MGGPGSGPRPGQGRGKGTSKVKGKKFKSYSKQDINTRKSAARIAKGSGISGLALINRALAMGRK